MKNSDGELNIGSLFDETQVRCVANADQVMLTESQPVYEFKGKPSTIYICRFMTLFASESGGSSSSSRAAKDELAGSTSAAAAAEWRLWPSVPCVPALSIVGDKRTATEPSCRTTKRLYHLLTLCRLMSALRSSSSSMSNLLRNLPPLFRHCRPFVPQLGNS